MLIVVWSFKLWSVYLFDIAIEAIDLFIISMNVPLVYKSRGDGFNIWLMVIIFLKSFFILIFSLVYIFFAWKNFLIAKWSGSPANPNKTEQYYTYEKDEKDEDFDKIMNNTTNPFFNNAIENIDK